MLDVVLCIETRIYRQGLRSMLEACNEVGEIKACAELQCLASMKQSSRKQVLLIDCSHESPQCTLAMRVLKATSAAQGQPVVAIGFHETEDEVLALIEAGAAAYITKNDSIDDLVSAMRAAVKGELNCAPRIAGRMQERLAVLSKQSERTSHLDRLSRREQHILGLVERSMSNKQIARELDLEVSTIKNHVHNIIVKLSVTSRTEAAAILRRIGNPQIGLPEARE